MKSTREMRWEQLANGKLLQSAADGAFEAFLSIDKKIQHEQNLSKLPIGIVVLDSVSNALPALTPFAPHVMRLLHVPLPKMLHVIRVDGTVLRLP